MCTPMSLARSVATARRTPGRKHGANFTYSMRQAMCSVSNPTCPSQLLVRLSTFPPSFGRVLSFSHFYTGVVNASLLHTSRVLRRRTFDVRPSGVYARFTIHVSQCWIGLHHRQTGLASHSVLGAQGSRKSSPAVRQPDWSSVCLSPSVLV